MIPSWNMSGVLPPLPLGAKGHEVNRSPYIVDMPNLIDKFATSPARIQIIRGLLNYRKALYDIGITDGFQWIDGSFMEDIEHVEGRDPNDVDVVTFIALPEGTSQEILFSENPQLFDKNNAKITYSVDGYYMFLGETLTPYRVKEISYWYSMWSHRRDSVWKGFLQVPLSVEGDKAARLLLNSMNKGGAL